MLLCVSDVGDQRETFGQERPEHSQCALSYLISNIPNDLTVDRELRWLRSTLRTKTVLPCISQVDSRRLQGPPHPPQNDGHLPA